MESTEQFFSALAKLNYIQAISLLVIGLLFFIGPVWLKKKYLKRVGKTIDARIEDRNSWIVFPPPYNFTEKLLLAVIYIVSFLGLIFIVNSGFEAS